jgi:hypothetical protein
MDPFGELGADMLEKLWNLSKRTKIAVFFGAAVFDASLYYLLFF